MKRIQRKRTKGWRMPENAVYVGRPGRLGNPFYIKDRWLEFKSTTGNILSVRKLPYNNDDNKTLVNCYKEWLRGKNHMLIDPRLLPTPPTIEEIRQFINGRDVACWCSLDKPCHADVLLEICNYAS